jgi:hypothetical protein
MVTILWCVLGAAAASIAVLGLWVSYQIGLQCGYRQATKTWRPPYEKLKTLLLEEQEKSAFWVNEAAVLQRYRQVNAGARIRLQEQRRR